MKVAEPVRKTLEPLEPSWQRWLALVEMATAESRHPVWSDRVHVRPSRPPESPLLHGATLHIDRGHGSRLVLRLAQELGILNVDRIDPLAVMLAGIERDPATVDTLAQRLAVPADTVAVLGQLAALPVLENVANHLNPETSRIWQRGYCPVCGAWPAIAEMRGIQRERRMRCGCCGGDWMLPVLRCAYCSEIEHRKLGFLQSEEGDQQVRIETCSTCRGYLKTFSTLSALAFPTLALKDLSTISFDIAARDRGYTRPAVPGWQLQVEIVQ